MIFHPVTFILSVCIALLFATFPNLSFSAMDRVSSRETTNWNSFLDENGLIEIRYHPAFRLTTDDDRKSKLLFRGINDHPNALFTIRHEDGLSKLQAVGGGSVLDKLILSLNKQFPARYPGYRKEGYEELILANEKAVIIVFSYLGNDGKTRVKEIFAIICRGMDAFYLTAQTAEKDFAELKEVFEQMIRSFRITS